MKDINQKNGPIIREKFWGVNTAIASVVISIMAGLNNQQDENLKDAGQAFTTAFYIALGAGAYWLQKKRYFGKAPKQSKLLEFLLLTPLVLHLLWYIIVHGYEWENDPYPLIIVSVVWGLIAYILLLFIISKRKKE